MLLTLIKKIQLFSFGFATSAGCLVMASIMHGDISGADVQERMGEISLQYLNATPEGVTSRMVDYFSQTNG